MLPQMGSVVMALQETYKDTHSKSSTKGCVSGTGQRTRLGQGICQWGSYGDLSGEMRW